jgi:hypothetical protein
MRRTVFVLSTMLVVFVAIFAVLVLRPVRKVRAHTGCSEASLFGNYALVMPGQYSEPPQPGVYEQDYSMLATFDGKGGFSGSSLNGVAQAVLMTGSGVGFTGGTYTVNHDCTVTMTIPANLDLEVFYDAYYAIYSQVDFYGVVTDTGGDEVAGTVYIDSIWNGTFDARRIGQGKWKLFD